MSGNLKSTLTKLAICPDDVLVVKVHKEGDAIGVGERLRRILNRQGINNTLIACHIGTSIEQLDPDTMAAHGWYRKATQRKD